MGKQAGAELGQAQLNLGLGFTLILCRFGFTGYSLVDFVLWILLKRFCLVNLVLFISNNSLGKFNFVDFVL